MAKSILTDAERFMQYVEPEPNTGCWLWTAQVDRFGYGRFWFGGETRQAHRVAWELVHGPILRGLHCLHRCDNRCVNPEHLFLGTAQDNQSDKARKHRGCKSNRGLPFGVTFNKKVRLHPFMARLSVHDKKIHLGCFATAEEAGAVAAAYKASLYAPA